MLGTLRAAKPHLLKALADFADALNKLLATNADSGTNGSADRPASQEADASTKTAATTGTKQAASCSTDTTGTERATQHRTDAAAPSRRRSGSRRYAGDSAEPPSDPLLGRLFGSSPTTTAELKRNTSATSRTTVCFALLSFLLKERLDPGPDGGSNRSASEEGRERLDPGNKWSSLTDNRFLG
jgi:hypothetical protein